MRVNISEDSLSHLRHASYNESSSSIFFLEAISQCTKRQKNQITDNKLSLLTRSRTEAENTFAVIQPMQINFPEIQNTETEGTRYKDDHNNENEL